MALRLVKVNMGAQQAGAVDAEVLAQLAAMAGQIEALKASQESLLDAQLEASKEVVERLSAPVVQIPTAPVPVSPGWWAKIKRIAGVQ